MRETALALMPQAAAISAAVQWVLSPGGGLEVNVTTRSATSGPSGAMREGRVLSCSKPTTPSCMNRSCQRQTQVLDLLVRRMISLVPRPSAESSTISARQTCFCGALRSFKITFTLCGAGRAGGQGDRPLHAAPPPRGVHTLPQHHQRRASGWKDGPCHSRQLRSSQASSRSGVAGTPQAVLLSLHAHVLFLA